MLVQQVKTTNQPTSPTLPSDERFETLLNAHEPELLRRGEIVEGTILVLDDNLVILDVGAKRDAIVPPQELAEVDDHFLDELETGDVVPVYVTHTPVNNQELLVSLEKGQREQDWQRAEECFNDQSLMELEVVGHNKGGILVQFGRLEGFVPNSHIPMLKNTHDRREYTHKKAKLVGSVLPVQIIELDRNRQRIIMSAAKAYEEQQKNHIDHPSAKLTVDDEIEVMVIDIDVERKRVSLSRKQLLPDPWEQFAAEYTVGDLIDGVVTSITDFGAFVRFDAGVEGLIHVSEMPLYVSGKPGDLLQLNERVLTRIVSIQPEQQRIGLSMRRVAAAEEIKWLAEQRHKSLPLAE